MFNIKYIKRMVLKEMFISAERKSLIRDDKFEQPLTQLEKLAYNLRKSAIQVFLGNRKLPIYREIVNQLLESYKHIG